MLSEAHKIILEASAIDIDLATTCGVHSITEPDQLPDNLRSYNRRGLGIAFPWKDYLTGEITHQVRLDTELDSGTKYIWPKGVPQKLARINVPANPSGATLLIEGYKQALAVYSTLGTDTHYAIIAMAGCYGTSTVDTSGLDDTSVYVILDADVRKKIGVWEAADGIGHQLTSMGCTVRYIAAPGTGSQGIDDCLAARKTMAWRKKMIDKLIAGASMELPEKPNVVPITSAKSKQQPVDDHTRDDALFDLNGKFLSVAAAARFVPFMAQFEGPTGPIRRFDRGVYRTFSDSELGPALAMLCGNAHQVGNVEKTWQRIQGELIERDEFPEEFLDEPWLNTPSGLFNLTTGEFRDHDPSVYSTVQIGTDYVDGAQCPVFDAWLLDMAGDQAETLLEYFGQFLDPTRAPAKHIILEGPAGSGKSTMIRIIQSVISGTYSGSSPFASSLTMHQLNEGGFHTFQLMGKLFNSAGELKADEINDITEFKMLTGDDTVTANVKNKAHVTFRPRALFCFAMNEFPKVRDAEPYFRRVAPFRFDNQKGKDAPDQSIEDHIRKVELSGVLGRLIEARCATVERGYLPAVRIDVAQRFQGETNPVLAWYHSEDNTTIPNTWQPYADVYHNYQASTFEAGVKAESTISFTKTMRQLKGFLDKKDRWNGKVVKMAFMPKRDGFTGGKNDPDGGGPKPPEPDPSPITPEQGEFLSEYYDSAPIEVIPGTAATIDHERLDKLRDHYDNTDQVTHAVINPKTGPVMTFDMETDGVNRFWDADPWEYLRLIGWKVGDDEDVLTTTPDDMSIFLNDLNYAGCIVGQNVIDFDLLALHRADLFDLEEVISGYRTVIDTMILARQLDPPSAKTSKAARPYSLRNLAAKHEIPIDKDVLRALAIKYNTSEFKWNEPGFTGFGEIPADDEEYVKYLRADVEVTEAVLKAEVGDGYTNLTNPEFQAKPDGLIGYLRREHRVAALAAKTRLHGVRVDEAQLRERVVVLDTRRAELLSTLVEDYDLPTEGKAPHSTDKGKAAIRAALLDSGMGEDEQPLTDGGSHSFSGDAMATIVSRNPGNDELRDLCNLVSELNGQRTVYHTVLDNLKDDGRVHPKIDFRQATGRWSVTEPGMTVLGKRGANAAEREIFLPDEGHLFVNADFAQVDARCVAAHSQDPNYLDVFQGGRDLHTEVAIACFGDPSRRHQAKAIGHGVNYGRGARGIAEAEGIEQEVAQQFIDEFFARYPKVALWQNEVRAQASRGELLNNGFGRRLRCDPERAYTQAPALVGQSCARDIAMESLLRMDKEVRDCLRMFIHDEFVFSIPLDKMDEYRAEIERAMTFEWRGVPFLGEPGQPATNWHQCYK